MTARKPQATTETPTEDAPKVESESAKRGRLYTAATSVLRKRHQDEFTGILSGLYQEEGLVYKPRLTESEKAEQAVRAALQANPDLLSRILQEAQQDEPEPESDEPHPDTVDI